MKLFLLRHELKKLKDKTNELIKINNELIEKNSKSLIELDALKKPFEDEGDLTWSAHKLLNKS